MPVHGSIDVVLVSLLTTVTYGTLLHQVWAEDLASPTILQPGAYRNICIELEIHGLAVGAVIVSRSRIDPGTACFRISPVN